MVPVSSIKIGVVQKCRMLFLRKVIWAFWMPPGIAWKRLQLADRAPDDFFSQAAWQQWLGLGETCCVASWLGFGQLSHVFRTSLASPNPVREASNAEENSEASRASLFVVCREWSRIEFPTIATFSIEMALSGKPRGRLAGACRY